MTLHDVLVHIPGFRLVISVGQRKAAEEFSPVARSGVGSRKGSRSLEVRGLLKEEPGIPMRAFASGRAGTDVCVDRKTGSVTLCRCGRTGTTYRE